MDVESQELEDDSGVILQSSIEHEINIFIEEPQLDEDYDILDFLEKKKLTYPSLCRIACPMLFQVATMEVNIEQLFSNLNFILNKLRNSLCAEILNDLLLLRSNFDIFVENIYHLIPAFLQQSQ